MKSKKKLFISLFLVFAMLILTSSPVFSAGVNEDIAPSTAVDNNLSALPTIDSTTIDIHSLNKSECMISEYVNAKDFNEASHIQRLADEEELDTYVFLNSDGSKSVYYMDENVKFVDKNGDVQEKDISLISNADGYSITRNEFDLHIPTAASSGISMSYEGYDVKITPQTTVRVSPAKKVDDSVVYDGFFGTNTSLKYTPMLSGVKEDVIMQSYIPDASFNFILDTDGLGLYNNKGEYYLAESESSKAVFNLGKVIIYDAIGKPEYGTMTVTTITEGQKYMLSLSAPEEFLTDPTTVYPVTIDPTLKVYDSANASGKIEDAVLFSGKPSSNYGNYTYLSIGYVDSTYGVGRVAVKLPGLYNSSQYINASDTEILSVKFYCWDTSGNSAQQVNLYRLTGAAWEENTVTNNTSMSYSTTPNLGTTMSTSAWTAFDITSLAKAWKTVPGVPANRGFILINSNETSASYKKSPYSSEYSVVEKRPYVVMVFDTTLTLNHTSINKKEGASFTMTASVNSINTNVTWESSNTEVATINSSGVVTAKKAGKTILTATHTDNNGAKYTANCTLYVRVDDGVYYIQNSNSTHYAHVSNGGIADHTDVFQYSMYGDTVGNITRSRQLWKVKYLSGGRYSIRPMNKLSSGLHVTNGNVDIYNIGTTDTRDGVPDYAEWVIEWDSTAYVFKNNGESAKTMQVKGASTARRASIIVGNYSASANCRWNLSKIASPAAGAYLYDTETKAYVPAATKAVDVGITKSLSELQLSAIAFSGTDISQNFTWYSSDNAIATVDSNGAVTGVSCGEATITGRVYRDDAYRYVSYTICVNRLLIYQTINTYYHDGVGNYAEDLKCGDMTEDELRALDWINWSDFVVHTPLIHRVRWENMCTSWFAQGELQTVILDMIDHFMDGTGLSYSNSILTQRAYEHDSTQAYIENVGEQLDVLINEYNGDISQLAYIANDRDSNPLVSLLKANNVEEPVYNTTNDLSQGLRICVNSLWGNKIEVSSYNVSGNSYSYTLHYTLYDHFGLDQADVEEYGYLPGFRSWYGLQHYAEYASAYKPFLTLIEFDVTVSGTIS